MSTREQEREQTTRKFFNQFVLKWEGGFSNRLSGDGQVTLLGMTAKQFAARHKRDEKRTEAEFAQMAQAINWQTGKILPTATAHQRQQITTFQENVYKDFKTAYYKNPGFDQIKSDHVGMIVADISFNRGPATTWWVLARMLVDNQGVQFTDRTFDPDHIRDPKTQPQDNPYLKIGNKENTPIREALVESLNNMVRQKGEAFVIAKLAEAKLKHHQAHVDERPEFGKFMRGWENRLRDYSAYHKASAPGPQQAPTPAPIVREAAATPTARLPDFSPTPEEFQSMTEQGARGHAIPKTSWSDWLDAFRNKPLERFYWEDVAPHLRQPVGEPGDDRPFTPQERWTAAGRLAIQECKKSFPIDPTDLASQDVQADCIKLLRPEIDKNLRDNPPPTRRR